MPTKQEVITELATQTAQRITRSGEDYMAFLTTAANNFKYSFQDQLLIFAQKPEATACAEIKFWNRHGRWVNKGTTGIALLRDTDAPYKLRYVFDMSDTNSRIGRTVPVWQMREQDENAVIEALANRYGTPPDASSLQESLMETAKVIAEDNLSDYYTELCSNREGSLLEELDADNTEVWFRNLLENSIAYMLLTRCGIKAREVLTAEDFAHVCDFNTPETISVLGTANSDIAEMALREIAATVLSQRRRESRANDSVANREEKPYAENKENPERSVEDGTGLQDGGRLLDSQSGGSRSPGAGQVWDAAAQLPPAAPQRNLHRDDALEQAGSAPRGDRPAGQRDDGAADTADGAAAGRDREPESVRPDGVGEPDEQHPGGSGGDGADRADLQLTSPPEARVEDFKVKVGPTGLEVSFHDFTARSGIDYYHEDSEKNELLRTSDALREHRKEIAAFFADHSDSRERGDFVKGFFNNTYVEAILSNGQRAGYRAWDDVLTLWRGSYPSREKEEYLRWPQVANTIEGMILLQQWLSPEEQSLPSEVEQISFIEQVEAEKASAFSLPQEAIDYVLCRSVDSQSKYRIHEQYLKHEGSNANVKCLKEEYGIGGRSNIIPGSGFFEDHDSKGIRLWRSSDTDEAKREEVLIGWGKVERRIAELIATDRYLNRAEKEQYLLRQAQDKQLVNPTEPAVPDPLEPPQDSDALAEAKRIIDGFCRREFGQEADDFADLTDVALGYTTATVDEYPVEFSADLIHYRLSYWAYDKVVDTIQFDDLDEMNRYLADLDFSMMVDHAAEKYEQQQNEIKAEEKARQLISEFCENEYDSPADFSDPENVSLAHSTTGDGDHFIDVSADLPEFSLNYQVDGETVATYQCYDMVGFAELLADLSCDEMIAVAEEQYATRRKKKDQQEQETDDFADIDPAAIRAALAESGIVDGHVVDPDKLDADPFIQQVMADVEQIAENEPPSLERFSVIETEGGYAVWDDIRDEIYVDGEGVQEEFTSEWQAEDYLKQVKKEVADKEAAEWLTVERTKEMAQEPAEKENVTQAGSNAVQPGMELAMHDRRFVVDSVDEAAGTVSLRDSTFQSDTGFPIFRSERIETVQRVLTEAAQEPKAEPAKLRSIVIDLSPRPEQEPEEEPQLSAPPAPKPRKNLPPILLHPEIPSSQRRDYRITDEHLGEGGEKTKFKGNLAAIETLKQIEAEDRLATPEEQEVLSRYVGWGGLPQAFDEGNASWANEYVQLRAALTEEEYSAARASTLNAHYTSPTVIRAIYKAMENLGFRSGNILEPSCGIGNFFGLVPESMAESKLYGVELDPITGRIARQLYQNASIAVQGFEKTELPDSFFDLAVGNVPFGSYSLSDKRYDKNHFLIHDYFFARTLDKVRPGGIIAFVTSKGTLDKANSSVRRYLAQRANLLGAIRLPNNAFLANAGTQVTTDILFLQKREKLTAIEPDWVHLGKTETGVPINQYFLDHPEMVLGEMTFDSMMYGNRNETTCKPLERQDLGEQLAAAIQNIQGSITEYVLDDLEAEDEDRSIPADPSVRNFSYTVVDGEIYYRENSRMIPVEVSVTAANRIKGLIGIRDCVRALIEYQADDWPAEDIQTEQKKLNALYDAFVAKYGRINSRANKSVFTQDSAYFLLSSLEVLDDEQNFVRKADMFTKRTIRQKTEITHVDTASEALAVSLAEKARVDLGYMASLMGGSEAIPRIVQDLHGVIFKDPATGPFDLEGDGTHWAQGWQAADEYLSGNVRKKLEEARLRAETDPFFKANAEALEQVQPVDLSPGEISVRLGATWLPPEDVEQFVVDLFGPPYYARRNIHVHYSKYTGEWNVEGKSADRGNIKANNTYGTFRINGYKIVEETLNLRDVRIFDYDENRNAILNKKETAIAQGKQALIKQAFQDWIWKDPERRERLTRLYNDKFNSIRPREYDGSHINFAGINPEITLRPHQINAIAHILYGGNTLLAHVVGAGKTWEMVAAAQESKRLGLCHKSLFVVPNHLTEQWASEYLQLYPAANILVATRKDFEAKNRKRFCGRIATGDYDAVILGHSQFEKIPMSLERQTSILEQQKEELVLGIADLKRNHGERFSIKQMEKSKKAIEAKLKKLNDQSRKDDVVTFEELGVDRIYIDEAHYYKNLAAFSKMRNVGGISQAEAQKSSDLYMKCRYLDELTGGHGVIFATGTPISNTMVEMYTMQKYLQYEALKQKDLLHFDGWASTYGETITAMELAPEGTGYRAKTRFSRFYNLPELIAMFREIADIQTADMLNLPVPKANYHNVILKPSEQQKEMVAALGERAEKIRNRMVDPSDDNMLTITNDGRKLALDQRLLNSLLPDSDTGKINACAENVCEIWQRTMDQRSTQMVFCDLSTPKGNGEFNIYDDLRDKLIAKGIPAEEIAYIHTANTEVQKKELFGKVRSGQIRVLLGSTQKMGAGTNVQQRLIALHHLDCPWRPSDLQQREGRIIRQGNENEEVDIYTYVTEGTFDSYLYQMVENKQKFVGQIMTSKSPARSAEDVDETALSYAEVKALCAGDPHIKEKMDLDVEVQRLKLLKSNHLSQKYALEDQIIKYLPQTVASLEQRMEGYTSDVNRLNENTHPNQDGFSPMEVEGTVYSDKKEAGSAILAACKAMTGPDPVPLGQYRGFAMELSFESFSKEFQITLKGSLTHTTSLGTDIFGNIQRLDNLLGGMGEKMEHCKQELDNVKVQIANAKEEVEKPFAQEEELKTKQARLEELNVLLRLDKRENEIVDGERDEDGPPQITQRGVVDMER